MKKPCPKVHLNQEWQSEDFCMLYQTTWEPY